MSHWPCLCVETADNCNNSTCEDEFDINFRHTTLVTAIPVDHVVWGLYFGNKGNWSTFM